MTRQQFRIICILILGLFTIALIDPNYRDTFVDLVQVGVGSCLGWAAKPILRR